jgi:hypothetical protein
LLAGVLLSPMLCKDGVGNLEAAMRCAIEASCVAGMIRLLRYGLADWANQGHRLAVLQVHIGWAPGGHIVVGALLSFHGKAFAVASF